MLLQQLLAGLDVPVFAAGGIGPHTAAAAVAGGASGVVLDVQLALVRETDLPAGVVAALKAMDGTETKVVDGHRVHPGTEPEEQGRAAGQEPLPVGQDAPLATALAGRYRTAGEWCGPSRNRSRRTFARPSPPNRSRRAGNRSPRRSR